jgi:hypothetical protein
MCEGPGDYVDNAAEPTGGKAAKESWPVFANSAFLAWGNFNRTDHVPAKLVLLLVDALCVLCEGRGIKLHLTRKKGPKRRFSCSTASEHSEVYMSFGEAKPYPCECAFETTTLLVEQESSLADWYEQFDKHGATSARFGSDTSEYYGRIPIDEVCVRGGKKGGGRPAAARCQVRLCG